ncbi:MAG: D-Ala-D-Ala carboxypeptidase family metallohydrolase [Eubacterium sp.]
MTILQIQRILTHLGYDPGAHDAIDGPDTQLAVKGFQSHRGIDQDGVVGPITGGHLIEAYKASTAGDYFDMSEYQCDCEGMYCGGFPVLMDRELLEKIDTLRQNLDNPIIITSGVRCENRNREVGGIGNSKHKTGRAADLYAPGIHYSKVADHAGALGLGVIEYPDEQFVHVEV